MNRRRTGAVYVSVKHFRAHAAARIPVDARAYQIAALSTLLLYGTVGLSFDVSWARVIATVGAALGAQCLVHLVESSFFASPSARGALDDADRQDAGTRTFDPSSALITGLSLSLLLRTNTLAVAAMLAAAAILSKSLLRIRGKHIFNPAAFALALGMSLEGRMAWISPGQWGATAWYGFAALCLGSLVLYRARRSDITLAFLGAYGGLLFARATWLGDPWEIPLHHLQTGALLIFAFFMISDPRSTPDSRAGRILFATTVAAVAIFIHFGLYRPNGLVWALVLVAPLTPVLDRLFPAERFEWRSATCNSSARLAPVLAAKG